MAHQNVSRRATYAPIPPAPGLLERLRIWHTRWQMRRKLEDLPLERLHDMGIDEFDMRTECSKPFWRP
ncbi:hypothetical protein RM543_02400 [Roseicyclus sp. F158]|uniref:DUF1127 domain-containing protein n=1 Tax=Tropicimonas omnivorans TaxID=3075590 RepID=A0ABU3DCT8_9RHOB|nr:hypothetical protein [Roseicyclus sp. F158]MDT0681521.1 hypothetical protein [Roseicyclus sp. F158]